MVLKLALLLPAAVFGLRVGTKDDGFYGVKDRYASYPQDAPDVPTDKRPFDVDYPEYKPVKYVAPSVAKQPVWADPAQVSQVDFNDGMHYTYANSGKLQFDKDGNPLSPAGRTGITDRGLLGKWGPNHAADPIVTRYNSRGIVEMAAIQRKDSGQWAIPGGMVDPEDKQVSTTAMREFREEAFAGQEMTTAEKDAWLLKNVFHSPKEVYTGPVYTDPRNTDNAWMETAVFLFHQEDPDLLQLHPDPEETSAAKWIECIESNKEYKNLYADHKKYVDMAVAMVLKDFKPPTLLL